MKAAVPASWIYMYRPVVHTGAMGHASQLEPSLSDSIKTLQASGIESNAMNVILAFVLPQPEMHSSISLQYIHCGKVSGYQGHDIPNCFLAVHLQRN